MPVSADVVEYLPTINAPATDLATVFEILNEAEEIRKKLVLDSIVVVMDQALYAKACEIQGKEDHFSHILLRMRTTFYALCNMLSIIGKQFADAGLKDLLIESQIAAEGPINGVNDGKHRLAWNEFLKWLMNNDCQRQKDVVQQIVEQIGEMTDDLNQEQFDGILKDAKLTKS